MLACSSWDVELCLGLCVSLGQNKTGVNISLLKHDPKEGTVFNEKYKKKKKVVNQYVQWALSLMGRAPQQRTEQSLEVIDDVHRASKDRLGDQNKNMAVVL